MVVTKVANEGIGAPENQVLLVAKDNEDYAEKIIQLFKDKTERERLGTNALKFMQQSWTWEFHFQKLERMLSQLIENQNKPVENYYPFSYNEIN
jgi:glycosyltransferase involved in cell wall biosynthesis